MGRSSLKFQKLTLGPQTDTTQLLSVASTVYNNQNLEVTEGLPKKAKLLEAAIAAQAHPAISMGPGDGGKTCYQCGSWIQD